MDLSALLFCLLRCTQLKQISDSPATCKFSLCHIMEPNVEFSEADFLSSIGGETVAVDRYEDFNVWQRLQLTVTVPISIEVAREMRKQWQDYVDENPSLYRLPWRFLDLEQVTVRGQPRLSTTGEIVLLAKDAVLDEPYGIVEFRNPKFWLQGRFDMYGARVFYYPGKGSWHFTTLDRVIFERDDRIHFLEDFLSDNYIPFFATADEWASLEGRGMSAVPTTLWSGHHEFFGAAHECAEQIPAGFGSYYHEVLGIPPRLEK